MTTKAEALEALDLLRNIPIEYLRYYVANTPTQNRGRRLK